MSDVTIRVYEYEKGRAQLVALRLQLDDAHLCHTPADLLVLQLATDSVERVA